MSFETTNNQSYRFRNEQLTAKQAWAFIHVRPKPPQGFEMDAHASVASDHGRLAIDKLFDGLSGRGIQFGP